MYTQAMFLYFLFTAVVGANGSFCVLPWCSWVTPTEWLPDQAVWISRRIWISRKFWDLLKVQ